MARAGLYRNSDGQVERGYRCLRCDDIFFEGSETTDEVLWSVSDEVSTDEGDGYFSTEPEKHDAWRCGAGCWIVDMSAPDIVDLYQCGDCHTTFTKRDDAADCC